MRTGGAGRGGGGATADFVWQPVQWRECKKTQKRLEWDKVCERVNAVGSGQRIPAEIKKKWSDLKVEVKRRTAALRRSTGQTGGPNTMS